MQYEDAIKWKAFKWYLFNPGFLKHARVYVNK